MTLRKTASSSGIQPEGIIYDEAQQISKTAAGGQAWGAGDEDALATESDQDTEGTQD